MCVPSSHNVSSKLKANYYEIVYNLVIILYNYYGNCKYSRTERKLNPLATVDMDTRGATNAIVGYDTVRALFDAIDVNSDGQLNKGELLTAVTRRRGKEPVLDQLFTKVTEVFPKMQLLTKPGSVRAALLEMDTDRDGTVSVAELVQFCQTTDDAAFVYVDGERDDLREAKPHLVPGEDVLLPEDVEAKAKRLGIDIETETHLIWIARQALLTPLPPDWEFAWVADEGRKLYFNVITDDKSIAHPANAYFKKMVNSQRKYPAPRTAGMDGAWMRFETSQGRSYFYSFKQKRRAKKCPFGVQLLVRPDNVKFSVLEEPGPGSGDDNDAGGKSQAGFSSSKLLDSRRRSLDDMNGAPLGGGGNASALDSNESVGRSVSGSRNMEHSPSRHIRDLAVLEFKSWWSETIQGMEKGSTRRYMDLLFSCETGQFQVILDRSDKVYTLSHIEGKHGPLEAWDLFVGARVNVLGRTTTLMQASGPTLDWLDYHCQRLQRASKALKKELKKYSMKVSICFARLVCSILL